MGNTNYTTLFAIRANEGSLEWAGSKKGFVPTEIPHKGLRYKSQAGALIALEHLLARPMKYPKGYNNVYGVRVIETYI